MSLLASRKPQKTGEAIFFFDSRVEAQRYDELMLLSQAGEINNLRLQAPCFLHVNNALICKFVLDFHYFTKEDREVYEDVKSRHTRTLADYRIKKKLFEALMYVPLTEVVK